jgi:hypothetical protein
MRTSTAAAASSRWLDRTPPGMCVRLADRGLRGGAGSAVRGAQRGDEAREYVRLSRRRFGRRFRRRPWLHRAATGASRCRCSRGRCRARDAGGREDRLCACTSRLGVRISVAFPAACTCSASVTRTEARWPAGCAVTGSGQQHPGAVRGDAVHPVPQPFPGGGVAGAGRGPVVEHQLHGRVRVVLGQVPIGEGSAVRSVVAQPGAGDAVGQQLGNDALRAPSRAHHRTRSSRQPRCAAIHSSTSRADRGIAAERLRWPESVTSTSSSMRMPIPRSSAGTSSSSAWKYRPGSTVST